MNTLSTRPLFLRHSLLLRLSFSTSASLASSFHSQRRYDEESRAVRVSVWWDFENCSLPSGANVFKVAHCITSAVRGSGIKGPVQITAFGDISQLARANQEALSATGITLTHVPSGGKNSADRSLLLDLMYWVSHNPPPAHLFLISGDRDFSGILHRLRMSNYNILLACPDDRAPTVLCSAASIMWQWNSLIRGESFAGKHFNQPPDGPYNSWYGHYKGVLQDPYAAVEPPAPSQTNDTSHPKLVSDTEAVPEQQLQPVPRQVLRKISRIVNSHPNGIAIGLLGSHMNSGEARVDKKFYGHKSFLRFLLSKPNLVKIKRSNGQFSVFPASCQASEPVCSIDSEAQDSSVTTKQKVEPNTQEIVPLESTSDAENHDVAASLVSKAQCVGDSVTTTQNEKFPLSSSSKADLTTSSSGADVRQKKNSNNTDKKRNYAEEVKGNKPSPDEFHNSESCGTCVIDKQCLPVQNHNSEVEMGYFQKLWAKWFKKKDIATDEKTDRASHEVQDLKPEQSNFVEGHDAPHSPHLSDNKLTKGANVDSTTLDQGRKSVDSPAFFTKLWSWFKLPKTGTDANISDEIRKSNQMEKSKKDELFLMDSFWCDIESFLNTYKGSKCIWNSKTREEIAQKLRKEGPLVIQPLEHDDVLQLIDLLISEKKWVKELPLSTYPFRVVRLTGGNAESTQTNNSGRLRSILLSSSSKTEKLPEQRENWEVLFDTTTKPCSKTKDEVLSDCKKLLDDMFLESPEAINIGWLKQKFVERYGYVLDNQKLGYPKLIYLLQTIPDLKVGLNFVYSSSRVVKESGSGDEVENGVAGKESDSPWEELGPVDGAASDKYESPASEDDVSDLDVEEEESKRRSNKDESSLLQILDSWHSDGNSKRESADMGQAESKQKRPRKGYSFVAGADECDDKDRLIDGILANLQRSGQQRHPPMH